MSEDTDLEEIVISEQAKAEFEATATSAMTTIEDVMARFFGIPAEISVITTPEDGEEPGTHTLHVATITPQMIENLEQPE